MSRRTVADLSEAALLSLALRDPSIVDEAGAVGLTPEDFGDRRYKALWSGMVRDRASGVGPDEATVLERHETDLGIGRPFPDLSALVAVVRTIQGTRAAARASMRTSLRSSSTANAVSCCWRRLRSRRYTPRVRRRLRSATCSRAR